MTGAHLTLMRLRKRIGATMSADDTEPNLGAKLKAGTEKADPFFDRVLKAAIDSPWTPWWVVGAVLSLIWFGVWVTR